MLYILYTVLAAAAAIALGFGVTSLIRKHMKKKPSKGAHIAISVLCGLAVLIGAGFIYLDIHYAATDEALAVVNGSDSTVTQTDFGYFFDGKGEDAALVFYQGGKVDAEAYAPLMRKIADNGVDCFLVKTPFRMAFFGANNADSVLSQYNYKHFLVGGHSLGGVVASMYAASHVDKIDGLVLLAAYPTKKIDDKIAMLSVYGTADRVLKKKDYEKNRKNWSENATELVIEGGNHANFGNYGDQRGDGEADISAELQQTKTALAIQKLADSINTK